MAESGIFPFSIPRASSRQPESVKNVKCNITHHFRTAPSLNRYHFDVNPRVFEVLNTKLQSADMATKPILLRPLGKHAVFQL